MAAAIDRFGHFTIDRDRRRLTADGRTLILSDRHFDVLLALTSRPGVVLSKEHLIDTAWHGVAVGDDSLYRAIRDLRDTLGLMPDGQPHIETHSRRGFRFAARIDHPSSPQPAPPVKAVDAGAIVRLLEPHVAFIDGRTALETLDANELARAREAFTHALDLQPDLTAAHIGLASAYLLQYESTRADAAPDRDALTIAEHHALHACTVQPGYADAWGTYALVSHRLKKYDASHDATRDLRDVAAARKAVSLEPGEWRHHLRLAFVAGGGERLRAAQRVLELRPGFALAHWMAATVLVGRQALAAAREHLRAGCDAQDAQPNANAGFTAVGLHLLHGLVLAAADDIDAAHVELAREVDTAPARHIYAREACANAWYARGALHLRTGDTTRARAALESALEHLPSHPLARVALLAASPRSALPSALPPSLASLLASSPASSKHAAKGAASAAVAPDTSVGPTEAALVEAAVLTMRKKHAEAARACERALSCQRTGPGALWILLVEPLMNPVANPRA